MTTLATLAPKTRDTLADRLRRPPKLTVSEWADAHRVLGRDSSEPGPWRTDRTPYLREIMDAFSDGTAQRIILQKSARVGGTEVMKNCVMYGVDMAPGPMLYVLPTEKDAIDEVAHQLKPMFTQSRHMRKHIPGKKTWATNEAIKLRGGLIIHMAWAAAPGTLTRRTIKFVFFDELDNCEKHAGTLGDNFSVAAERLTTFGHKGRALGVSTPTIPGASCNREFEASDKRRYHVPCPLCGVYQVLQFDQIKIPKNERDANVIEAGCLAWYECIDCHGRIDEHWRTWMVARGVWVPEALKIAAALPVDDLQIVKRAAEHGENRWTPEIEGTRSLTNRIGFHIWSAYSPWRTWSMIMAEFLRTRRDQSMYRVFVNSWLGETYTDAIEATDPDELSAKRHGGAPRDIVPDGCRILVCGADVQLNVIYYIIRGWGYRQESWLIREGIVSGFDHLYDVCTAAYAKQDGQGVVSPRLLAIDSGYKTDEVYDFARTHAGVIPTKGQPSGDYPVRPRKIDYTPKGTLDKKSVILHHVNTPMFKSMAHRLAKVKAGDPNEWHLHRETTDDYCKQFTAEHQVWVSVVQGNVKRRKLIWQPKTEHAQNHYLDAEVAALAIAHHKGILALRDPDKPDPNARPPEPSRAGPRKFGQRPMGWKTTRRR